MKKNVLPQLNVAKQEDLLSTPINQMVVYDHLTKSLNRTHYAGRDLYWFAGDAIANIAKKRIDNALLAEGKQVIASAVKGVPEMSWNGDLELIQYPLAEKFSQKMAGNLIVFNHRTGLYEVLPDGNWLGFDPVVNGIIPRLTSMNQHTGMHAFLVAMGRNDKARDKIVAEFAKSRQK